MSTVSRVSQLRNTCSSLIAASEDASGTVEYLAALANPDCSFQGACDQGDLDLEPGSFSSEAQRLAGRKKA
jgi:hypothetical protein